MRPEIDGAAIAALIPHAGTMCLLDAVRHWDAAHIVCTASGHRDPANPLRHNGQLAAICGIEYAAQAMAVHGGLTAAAARPAAGYLASVRDVRCHVPRLDSQAGDLEIAASKLGGDRSGALYGFVVRAGSRTILEGRAAVVLDAGVSE